MGTLFLTSEIPGGASTQCSRDFREKAVMIGVGHLKNVDHALASGYINTLVLGVVVKIIRIFGAGQGSNHAA
jgi:hypothetical protein